MAAEGSSLRWGADRSLLPTHTVQHRFVYKRCGPDGQWVRGPRGQPWRNASQCQMDNEEIVVQVSPRPPQPRPGGARRATRPALPDPHCDPQKEVAKLYGSFQVMYTVGYCLSLGALILALVILLGLRYAPGLQQGGPRRAGLGQVGGRRLPVPAGGCTAPETTST